MATTRTAWAVLVQTAARAQTQRIKLLLAVAVMVVLLQEVVAQEVLVITSAGMVLRRRPRLEKLLEAEAVVAAVCYLAAKVEVARPEE